MRFFENGPSIPAHLLEQRALGNVIFFCGAGISRRAGLPDFEGLTRNLIRELQAGKAAKALQDKESFDRVFNALIGEFGTSEIDRRIYDALKTPKRPYLNNHRTILALSRNLNGIPQVVTTNFDLLFERAHRKARWSVPPSLPELSLGATLDGIIYLHGRLKEISAQSNGGYIISSADFGRAYLAEGWATRFVKALRERFTIVLLGYSANDPPVRYLLEGLHSQNQGANRSPIYAFAPGSRGEAEEEWRDRGVTPIAYTPLDKHHSGLWNTLSAWAEAAADPASWEQRVLALAAKRPSELRPFERGQVTQLISTKAGAKLFADANPSPPAEWLCVFDENARYAEPQSSPIEEGTPPIDPLNLFGLDDDPARPPSEPNKPRPRVGPDFLKWAYGDTSFPERMSLAGWSPEWTNPLPERLDQLARWFGKVAEQPAAIWWAAGWASLHPGLIWYVNRRFRDQNNLPPQAKQFWQFYLEGARQPVIGQHDLRWYDFLEVLKIDGWSSFAYREFERLLEPWVSIGRASLRDTMPPTGDWPDLRLGSCVHLRVMVLDQHNDDYQVPDDELPKVVQLCRTSLERVSLLLDEVGISWLSMLTLYPEQAAGDVYHGKKEQFFLWLVAMFDRLKGVAPKAAKIEASAWNSNDPYFFGKLTMYALADPRIASAKEVARLLVSMRPSTFFQSTSRRELLFALRARWTELKQSDRRAIERKIIRGRDKYADETRALHRKRIASIAASILRWLEINHCPLTPQTAAKLPRLKAAEPNWSEGWAGSAADSTESRSGWIETVTETNGIEHLPIGQIVEAAEKGVRRPFHEFREYQPFQGLVQNKPSRALAALRWEAKRSNFPIKFWEELLSAWPDGASLRLRWLAASAIAALPNDVAIELRFYAPNWLNKNFDALSRNNRDAALKLFDKILAPFLTAPANATDSSMGESSVGGIILERSQVSYSKAINSPIGNLTASLFALLHKGKRDRPLPKYFTQRLDLLFKAPGHGAGHAACVAGQRMGWLDYYHATWVRTILVPIFALDNPLSEGAWHGRAYDQNGLSTETWLALLPSFIALLSGTADWTLDENDAPKVVRSLVWLSRRNEEKQPLIQFSTVQTTLMEIDDRGRADVLHLLWDLASKGEWDTFVKPFLEKAWPRQLRYRSEETSRAFTRVVEAAGADFEDAVRTVLPFLRPVPHLDMLTYRLVKSEPDQLDFVRSYPAATLSLLNALIADDLSTVPYELPSVLAKIGEAAPSLQQTSEWRRLQALIG